MKQFINSVWLAVMLAFVCLRSFAASPDLASSKFQFEAAVASLHGLEMADRQGLGEKYTNVLNTLKGQAQGAGDLDGVRYILSVLERFSKTGKVPANGDREGTLIDANGGMGSKAPELKKLFEVMGQNLRTVDQRTAREVLKLAVEYDKSLLDLQSELTKAGKIEQALAVKEERALAGSSSEIKAARDLVNGVVPVPAKAGTPTVAAIPIPAKAGTPTVVAVPSQPVAKVEGGAGVAGVSRDTLAQQLVGTKWSYPPAEKMDAKRAFISFRENGRIDAAWDSGGAERAYSWSVREDGAVKIAWKNKVRIFQPDAALQQGVLRESDGDTSVMKRVESR